MCHPVHTLQYFLHWLTTSTNLLQSSIDFTCGHHDALVVDAERVPSTGSRARRQGAVRAGRVLPPPPDAAAVWRKETDSDFGKVIIQNKFLYTV